MTTTPRASGTERLLRNTRPTRWLHGVVWLTTLAAGVSGIALWGDEGVRAVASLLGGHASAARLHRWTGYAVPVAPLLAVALRPRTVWRFFKEITRLDRGDVAWWRRFPLFLATPSRYPPPRHRGHFDPGQRLMAWGLILSLAALTITGVLMITAVGVLGPRYGIVLRLHTWSSLALGLLVAGHVFVSLGIPKGYRGVWRAMHPPGHGQVPTQVARRLWPDWADSLED
jgi:cytochrome b subunit of formate dehydrogenase